jgi:hypothetical protein
MKLLSAEINLGSAKNVSNHPLVRVYNSDSSAVELTRKSSVGAILGKYTIPAGKVIYSEKAYTDTLEGGEALKATAVGYSEMMEIISLGGGVGGWSGVTDSLLGRYDFNDTDCYSGAGTAINDLSGNSNNATKNSDHSLPSYSSTYAGTDIGNTFLFGQNQSEISFGGSFPPSSAADLSIFTWFRPTSFGNSYNVMFSKIASSGWDFALMMKNTSGSNYRLTFESASDLDSHGTNLSIDTWYYLGFTVDGPNGDLKLYVSQSSFDSSPSTHSNEGRGTFSAAKPFYIGEERSFNAGAAGYMSQLQVYNKVLSATEVEQNYDADKARYGY